MKTFLLFVIAASFLTGCGLFPEKVSMNDSRVQALLKAASSFDRVSYGFSPIPDKADVRLELRSTDHYDAMLHIYSKTSRTFAFRKTDTGDYKWIGEQEIFQGPKKYTTVDGTFYENICLNYDIEPVSGYPINQLSINYSGEDPRLVNKRNLTLNDVKHIIQEWKNR